MSTAAASSSVGELTTDVNCTVEHLKELGKLEDSKYVHKSIARFNYVVYGVTPIP